MGLKDMINNTKLGYAFKPDNRPDNFDLGPYSTLHNTSSKDGKPAFSKNARAFSWRINSNYHDGPVCFNPEQNTMYLTRVNTNMKLELFEYRRKEEININY